jgi:hypothetical protein
MLQAYIGIVSRRGLEVFCPEHPQTMRFLRQRARRERGRVACCWSVLPREVAEPIRIALLHGQPWDALDLMQEQAFDCGVMLPWEDEDDELA